MTREQIEKEAREYSDVMWNNDRARDISKIAFFLGAQWRINSVWHDGKDIPIECKPILFVNSQGGYEVAVKLAGMDWEIYCNNAGLLYWAYVQDLLPERNQ